MAPAGDAWSRWRAGTVGCCSRRRQLGRSTPTARWRRGHRRSPSVRSLAAPQPQRRAACGRRRLGHRVGAQGACAASRCGAWPPMWSRRRHRATHPRADCTLRRSRQTQTSRAFWKHRTCNGTCSRLSTTAFRTPAQRHSAPHPMFALCKAPSRFASARPVAGVLGDSYAHGSCSVGFLATCARGGIGEQDAIERFMGQRVETVLSSRTDAGVHATENAFHVDLDRRDRHGAPVVRFEGPRGEGGGKKGTATG